jgi:prophage maintenance system killer protein
MSKQQEKIKARISKTELPSADTVINININFLIRAKQKKMDKNKKITVYKTHDLSYNQVKKQLLHFPAEDKYKITQINLNFPEKANIYAQCAYYFRAFGKAQIFPDANHRTGYFALSQILRKKGLKIDADYDELRGMMEYIRGEEWIEQTEMNVYLKEKDEIFKFLEDWFKNNLVFRE